MKRPEQLELFDYYTVQTRQEYMLEMSRRLGEAFGQHTLKQWEEVLSLGGENNEC